MSSHLFAVLQGHLKVIAGVDKSINVTSKGGDDEFLELYTFEWTTLLIPPTTLLLLNFIGVVVGILGDSITPEALRSFSIYLVVLTCSLVATLVEGIS